MEHTLACIVDQEKVFFGLMIGARLVAATVEPVQISRATTVTQIKVSSISWQSTRCSMIATTETWRLIGSLGMGHLDMILYLTV